MERLSQSGHTVRVIDFEILWRKHRISSIISKKQTFVDFHKATEDGRVTVIRPPIIRLPFLDYVSLILSHGSEIRRQISDFKPDVVVCFGILNARIALTVAGWNDIPAVYYIIDELHQLVPQRFLRKLARLIESSNMRDANLVLSINEALRDYTIQSGADRSKTLVVGAGVDVRRFSADYDRLRSVTRNRYGFTESDVVLLFMGWLYEFTGLREVAIELSKVSPEDVRLKLLVVGDGELREALVRIKSELGLGDRLMLDKWLPYDDVPALVMSSDIGILPAYKNEIMKNIVPIKLYEYMAAGKPVIATNLKGIVREFGENNGLLFSETPEEVITIAIELARSGRLTEEGDRARRFVAHNDWNTVARAFEYALTKLIVSNSSSDEK